MIVPPAKPLFRLRDYSREIIRETLLRMFLMLWRRQSGKTTTLALRALREMAAHAGRLITFASASLLVGREVIEKEAHLFREILRHVQAQQKNPIVAEDAHGRDVLADGTDDDFVDAFESRRMVVKLWHDNTVYSRTQVIAPNPATARGFTGSVMIDECGLIADFRGVWDAMIYIMSSDPSFTCLLATTPPIDDNHFSHELLLPPPGMTFDVNPAGHWYESTAGLTIHRVDVHDGIAAGAKLYHPKTGAVLSAEEDRRLSLDRESWDRNMGLTFSASGTAACSRLALERAQSHALSPSCIAVDDGEEPPADWLENLRPGLPTALGLDLGTTEGEKSNPSSLTVAQHDAGAIPCRLVWRWKTKDPAIANARIEQVVKAVSARLGRAPRCLCIDATSERYWALMLQAALRHLIQVELVIGSETLVHQGQTFTMKQYTSDGYVNDLDDGRIALAACRWLFDDHRLVRKTKGRYEASVASDGCHADSFDSNRLARHGLTGAIAAPAVAQAVSVRVGYEGGYPL
ncbi:hypothetical protein OPIT5_29325 [Opitutaceae bacterium TAV5]|nr:hypothetical protein OPIT5_21795 [Opitutaceae bacterium TAV5]AHF93680.1 hypothetical protein OPIT5_29325 [Opitutaceae bacterium TAV5]